MGDFTKAIAFVLQNEGGLSQDPDDAGGTTKFGISARTYPDLDIANLTQEQAVEIYRRDFWGPYAGFEDPIATKLFDLAVHMGHRQAVKVLQRALRCTGASEVVDDGILGPITRRAVSKARLELLLTAIKSEAAGVYRQLAALDTTQQKFLNGWIKRAYRA